MLDKWIVIGFSLGYASLLFAIAWWAEKRSRSGVSLVNNPYIYALSLAVYCTAWTYYGSVGRASVSGLQFLTIYIGPTLLAPLWWIILRKMIRICKAQNLTSLADFIAARYGKSSTLGVLVAIFCVLGVTPYIALQLKAIATSYSILVSDSPGSYVFNQFEAAFYQDTAFYIVLALIAFTILFGVRRLDVTERHEGLVIAIAFESIVKLFAFLLIGLFVCYGLFDNVSELFGKAALNPELKELFTFNQQEDMSNWFWISMLSLLAFLFLPRQFQLAVVENTDEKNVNKAMWLFPLYLLVINLFVLPIAFGGKLLLPSSIDADTYVLSLPLAFGKQELALLAYIGGFSAATSMIIVSTVALSIMLSNNVSMPLILSFPSVKQLYAHRISSISLFVRRFNVALILLLAYLYFKEVAGYFSLVSIGVISFAAIAQFAPSVIGGLFWKTGNKKGALAGIIAGFAAWFYTLVLPTIVTAQILPESIMQEGPFGLAFLHPYHFMGLHGLEPITHGVFWSLFFNLAAYLVFSLYTNAGSIEDNQAEFFVDVFKYENLYEYSTLWNGTAYLADLRKLLHNLLGEQKTEIALAHFRLKYHTLINEGPVDAKLLSYTEKLLSGSIGATSARIMVGSVIKKEEDIKREEVFEMLRETQQILSSNRELQRKTEELARTTKQLQETNEKLKLMDLRKDEFITTVTHEMRTPLTSIRAFSEILVDNPDIEGEERLHFLQTIIKETNRMNRLINQVLDLEKFETGTQKLSPVQLDFNELIHEAVEAVEQLLKDKNIQLEKKLQADLPSTYADADRLMQVLINLLSNAIKFCPEKGGKITLLSKSQDGTIRIELEDNGRGLEEGSEALIFDKFYQVKDQTSKKPVGSGLGLAISRKIVEYHNGSIWAESTPGPGAKFTLLLPIVKEIKNEEQPANKLN